MTNRYYILYSPGAGGFFLTSVLMRAFNLPVKKDNISNLGDCHDLGNGPRLSTEYFDEAGFVWRPDNFKYNFCINGHFNDITEIKKKYPDIKVVLINIEDDSDLRNMATLKLYKIIDYSYSRFVKKFNITEWPSLDDVLTNPEIIRESFIGYEQQWFKEWLDGIDFNLVDIVIPFKSVFGLNNISLESILEEKFSRNVDAEISQYIKTYQAKNREYITA